MECLGLGLTWRSRQAPKLPPSIPVLMLGGARDEVVPRSHMKELWGIIRNRGRNAASKKSPVGSEKAKKGVATEEDEEEDEDEKENGETRSGSSSRSRHRSTPGSDDRKVPPRIVDGGNTYIEFPDGTHSEQCLIHGLLSLFFFILIVLL
jgi:abhydrolase domain-containing protein 13